MRRIGLAVLVSAAAIFAFPHFVRGADSWRKLYQAGAYRSTAGRKLPYRLLKPEKIAPGKSYPLVLFLHGGGENGSDNDLHLYIGAEDFAKPENRAKHPCFVVFPQCPLGDSWGVRSFKLDQRKTSGRPRDALDAALELVDKLAATLPIDKRRVYVTGLCTGGIGTWNCAAAAAQVVRRSRSDLRQRRHEPGGAAEGRADLGIPRRPRSGRARRAHQSHDRSDSQGRRPSEDDDLPRRQPQLLERNVRESRGDGLAVRAEENEVTLSIG